MKTTVTIQTRAFPVKVRDLRTGEVFDDTIVLDKARLRAAGSIGLDSKALILSMYNRRGYTVEEIGPAVKGEIVVDLDEQKDRP